MAVLQLHVCCLVEAGIECDDPALHALALYRFALLDRVLDASIYCGASHIVTGSPTPDKLLPLIEQHRISGLFAPPTVSISRLRSRRFESTDPGSLCKGCCGASSMTWR